MESVFDGLIVIACIVIAIVAKISNKKPNAAAPKKQPADLESSKSESRLKEVSEVVETFADLVDNPASALGVLSKALEIEDTAPAKKVLAANASKPSPESAFTEGAPQAADEGARALHSGESAADAHGCIGGSMPEHAAEGESIAEHAAHELRRQERLAQENASAPRAESLSKLSAKEMRRAVILSEVLAKPLSLRNRRI